MVFDPEFGWWRSWISICRCCSGIKCCIQKGKLTKLEMLKGNLRIWFAIEVPKLKLGRSRT